MLGGVNPASELPEPRAAGRRIPPRRRPDSRCRNVPRRAEATGPPAAPAPSSRSPPPPRSAAGVRLGGGQRLAGAQRPPRPRCCDCLVPGAASRGVLPRLLETPLPRSARLLQQPCPGALREPCVPCPRASAAGRPGVGHRNSWTRPGPLPASENRHCRVHRLTLAERFSGSPLFRDRFTAFYLLFTSFPPLLVLCFPSSSSQLLLQPCV